MIELDEEHDELDNGTECEHEFSETCHGFECTAWRVHRNAVIAATTQAAALRGASVNDAAALDRAIVAAMNRVRIAGAPMHDKIRIAMGHLERARAASDSQRFTSGLALASRAVEAADSVHVGVTNAAHCVIYAALLARGFTTEHVATVIDATGTTTAAAWFELAEFDELSCAFDPPRDRATTGTHRRFAVIQGGKR